jgi:FixJ family two-component response regulator
VIFIIDDDKYVLRGFQILLKSAGLECDIFMCAKEFLKSWEHDENDLLILDMHMPGMSGCNLLEYLKRRNLHPHIIIVTAYDENESRECSNKYGTLAYLLKPVDSGLLIDIIKNKSHNFQNTDLIEN